MATREKVGFKDQLVEDSFISPPLVSSSTVYGIGLFLFVLAYIWPPLLLVATAAAARFVTYAFRLNDISSTRRQMLREFESKDEASAHVRKIPEWVVAEKFYWENDRGLLLYTMIMTPKDKAITAVACYCHGYGDDPTYTKMNQLSRLVKEGIAVVIIEYEGFGHSDGMLGLVLDFEGQICKDTATFFQETCKARFPGKPTFLIGESMGGAVAFCVYNLLPDMFSGVVFLCPMCKIADEMLPPQWVIDFSRYLTGPTGSTTSLGELPIAPARADLRKISFKLPEKRLLWTRHPCMIGRNPRLATGREMIDVTKHISETLPKFSAPFLVQHGKSDRVTDPKLSQALYDESKSTDKTIRLYDGVWHTLINGEPDENIDLVLNDTVEWILKRAKKSD